MPSHINFILAKNTTLTLLNFFDTSLRAGLLFSIVHNIQPIIIIAVLYTDFVY